jgi:hypothetical protein
MILAVRAALAHAFDGDEELQYVASIHRDTANPHVDVALGSVSPITLRAHETWQIHQRLDRAARTIELAHGLVQERGLAVIRDGRVEKSSFAERRAWKREGQGDQAVAEAARRYLALHAEFGSTKILGLASTRLDAKHANLQVREALRGGPAQSDEAIIRTDGGYRYFAIGDPIMLTKNNKKLGVHNGDNGVVVGVSEDRRTIIAEIPRLKTTLSLGSTYRSIEYGWFTTVHKAQGATVEAAVEIANPAISAQMLYVAASRPRGGLAIVVPKSAFASVEDFADHVASRIELKDDALLFEQVVERFGGRNSIWAQRVRHAIAVASDPLRQQFAAALRARKEELEIRKHLLRNEYRPRLADPKVKAEFASRMKALAGEFSPPSFVTWCANHGPEITGKWVVIDDRAPHIAHDDTRSTTMKSPRPDEPALNYPHVDKPFFGSIEANIGFESGRRT